MVIHTNINLQHKVQIKTTTHMASNKTLNRDYIQWGGKRTLEGGDVGVRWGWAFAFTSLEKTKKMRLLHIAWLQWLSH